MAIGILRACSTAQATILVTVLVLFSQFPSSASARSLDMICSRLFFPLEFDLRLSQAANPFLRTEGDRFDQAVKSLWQHQFQARDPQPVPVRVLGREGEEILYVGQALGMGKQSYVFRLHGRLRARGGGFVPENGTAVRFPMENVLSGVMGSYFSSMRALAKKGVSTVLSFREKSNAPGFIVQEELNIIGSMNEILGKEAHTLLSPWDLRDAKSSILSLARSLWDVGSAVDINGHNIVLVRETNGRVRWLLLDAIDVKSWDRKDVYAETAIEHSEDLPPQTKRAMRYAIYEEREKRLQTTLNPDFRRRPRPLGFD